MLLRIRSRQPIHGLRAVCYAFLTICSTLVAPIVLAGCRRSAALPPGAVRLTVWSMWTGHEEENFQRVLDRYHELYPHVFPVNLGAVNDDTKTVRAIVAGVPPDFCTLNDPLYLGPLAANGALQPLDARFKASGLKESQIVPAALRQCRYRHRLYALPFLIDDGQLMWNKALFRQAGLDPETPPKTLEELEQFAVRLTRNAPDGTILQLGIQPFPDLNNLLLSFNDFGGRLYDERSNRVTPDDPGNVRALAWYKHLIDHLGGYRRVNAFAAGFGQAQSANNPFFVNKVAMKWDGEWNPYWTFRYAPQIEYGVAPIPPPASMPQRARSTWLGGNMFCIPRGSKHPDEAWKFMVWMQSDEAQILFASAMNNVPNTYTALRSPQLRTGAPYRLQYAKFLDAASSPNAGNFPPVAVANLYNSELASARDFVLDGRKTPEQALRDVRIRVQRELDRYK